MDLILGGVDAASLGEDLPSDLLVGAGGLVGRHRGELAAVDGDHPDPDQSGLGAEAEDLAEEIAEGPLVADSERAIVAWSGAAFAVITRKATSSRQRRSIPRELRSPTE